MGSTRHRFETLLEAATRPTSSEFKGELVHLSTRLKERQSRGSSSSVDFFNTALSTLSRVKGTTHAELRMSCLVCCVQFFYTAGFAQYALRASRELEALALQVHEESWMRRARNLSGIVNADVGNLAEALICYTDALLIARTINDRLAEISVLNNLGSALMYGGLSREAIQCFERVARQSDNSSPEGRYASAAALSNIAQIHLSNDAHSEGIEAIKRCLALIGEPHDAATALSRTIAEFAYVQLAVGIGRLELARERLELCIRFSRWDESRRSVFLAAVAEGLYDVHAGQATAGIEKLETALQGTKEFNHARSTCLAALVKAFDAASQPERALHYLSHLLNQVRTKREASIAALMEIPRSSGWASDPSDKGVLRVLERREYEMRAVVAEREVVQSRMEMFERLAITADLKEEESGEHGYRVGKLSALLADELNWSREASNAVELAARLHDIGKIGVPDRILLSSQQLKDAERHFIGTHTVIGAELLANGNVPQLRMAEDVARYHHEWWDGSGYPSKLRGKRIPLHARIVALADVFDALTHGRPYSAAWTIDRALEEIRNRRGTQFDPDLTDRFLELVARLRVEHSDLDAYLAKAALNSPFAQARSKIRSLLAEEHANERHAAAIH